MKMLVMVLGLMISTAAFGEKLAEMNKAERCNSWVTNAMHGATQAMRGASREVQYISKGVLFEMLTHSGGLATDKIYILASEEYTQDERDFLENSTFFGYDAMLNWQARNTDRGPSRQEWQRNLMAACLENEMV